MNEEFSKFSKFSKKSFSQQLTDVYIRDYMEKIFYFSLKKTGNQNEAEDLSSEINEDIITAISKGTIPEYFSAWVWKIARNRYSLWVKKKVQKNLKNSVSGADIFQEYELEDTNSISAEEIVIAKEELSILRRELSLISKEYRDILIAYYIDDKKVKTISSETGLPEGTIKTKLYKSRKILMEGMKMAREFGIRSYKPEDVNFTASGTMDLKYPWSAVKRIIPKNILLEAHNNPSTIQELSLELGIAVPYLEEEIGFLLDSTLLVKTDNDKYVTNFYIFDRDMQREIYDYQRAGSKLRSELIHNIVSDSIEDIRKIDFKYGGTDSDFKWFTTLFTMHLIYLDVMEKSGYNDIKSPERPKGHNWMFTGYESGSGISEGLTLGHNINYICNDNENKSTVGMFAFFDGKGIDYRASINTFYFGESLYMGAIKVLYDIIKYNKNINSLTDEERKEWNIVSGKLAHADKDGNVVSDIPILNSENMEEFKKIIKAHSDYEKFIDIIVKDNRYIEEMLRKKSSPILHKCLGYYVSTMTDKTKMMTIHDLEDSGDLIIPSDPETSPMGIYLYFR